MFVPNVPCGVERIMSIKTYGLGTITVPNVPCGVESRPMNGWSSSLSGFLMYRVELKVVYAPAPSVPDLEVPNVPCGVESWLRVVPVVP